MPSYHPSAEGGNVTQIVFYSHSERFIVSDASRPQQAEAINKKQARNIPCLFHGKHIVLSAFIPDQANSSDLSMYGFYLPSYHSK